jgi:hypothetical protein
VSPSARPPLHVTQLRIKESSKETHCCRRQEAGQRGAGGVLLTRRRKAQGCAFQSMPGNQLSSTRMNKQNRYICTTGRRRARRGRVGRAMHELV